MLALAFCAALGTADAARAGGCFVILPNTLELCTNGARFMVREFDACGAGATMHAGFWNQATTTILHSSSHTFGAQGDVYRYELSYPTAGYVAGNLVALTVSDNPAEQSGSLGTTIEVPIEDCRLLDPIETANSWSGVGTVGILNDSSFDYDGDSTETDAAGFGPFRLLSTARAIAFNTGIDVDGSESVEWDIARIAQSFAPRDPCYLAFRAALYTNDTVIDDLTWIDIDGTIAGFSLPNVSDSPFSDWPAALDGVPRAAPSVGGDLGGVGYSQGGALLDFGVLPAIGGDGESHTFGLSVADEGDQLFDSALAVARVRCDTTLLFAAGFEVGFLEWDAVVGEGL